MFRVAKMGVVDFPFAVQLANTMDWGMAVEDFKFAVELEPEGCFVLLHGSERVGVATCVSYGRVGWFGNLVVEKAFRRKGAGAFLVRHAINYLKGAGAKTVGLYAYPHLIGFYEQFGFKADVDFLVLEGKTASPVTGETEQLQMVKPQDFPALIDFDSRCFGSCRRKLLEPMLHDKDKLCYMAVDEHGIVGYGAAMIHAEAVGVGPLMCCSDRGGVAVALLQAILDSVGTREVFICVPAEETSFLFVLSKAELREKFRVTRMFLGPATGKSCRYIAESLERG